MIRLRHGGPVKVAANQRFFHIAIKFFFRVPGKTSVPPGGRKRRLRSLFWQILRTVRPAYPSSGHAPRRSSGRFHSGTSESRHDARQPAPHILPLLFSNRSAHLAASNFPALNMGIKSLIAEVLMGAHRFHMMFKLRGILDIHVSRIPFTAKGGNAVSAPVDKNSEFSLPEPAGKGMGAEGIPVILVFSFSNHLLSICSR